MSRIYDNQPLRSVPVNNVNWPKAWNEQTFQKGGGLLLEAVIKGRSRYCITDIGKNKSRYFVFHVEITKAHKRHFDSTGKEIEPNFSQTQKVSTGYLSSSYKVEAKGQTDHVPSKQAEQLLTSGDLTFISASYCPAGSVSLWIEESFLQNIELDLGDEVRIKTKGDSPFIYNIAKLDTQSVTVSNFASGEAVGGSWTDKIMTVKAGGDDKGLPQQENEGVDEDEWDD